MKELLISTRRTNEITGAEKDHFRYNSRESDLFLYFLVLPLMN